MCLTGPNYSIRVLDVVVSREHEDIYPEQVFSGKKEHVHLFKKTTIHTF
uniref:Uncharacterized protein n=1 Tax=Anguilla anguilla TaxID=7936 RepID=A0A0E9U1V8_ANGAN